jgi:hypothetical protein
LRNPSLLRAWAAGLRQIAAIRCAARLIGAALSDQNRPENRALVDSPARLVRNNAGHARHADSQEM